MRPSTSSCHRQWEISAARDGRLDAGSLASLHNHLGTGCRACEREHHYTRALARDLQHLDPPLDEVSLRRLRQLTLARADRMTRAKPRAEPRWLRACLAIAAVGCTLFIASRSAWLAEGTTPLVTVVPRSEPSRWSQLHTRDAERVLLHEGMFKLIVQRRALDRRVVVQVPEGEIEGLGSAFSVSVHGGHTRRISVAEGAVVLRRPGQAERRLDAGSTFALEARSGEFARDPGSDQAALTPVATTPPAAARAHDRLVHAAHHTE